MNKTCDVLVIGAGSAGIAAAVAAARAGMQTCLLEKTGVPGGIAARLHLGTICGLYRLDDTGNPSFINEGLSAEWATRLMRRDDMQTPRLMGRVYVLPYRSPTYRSLAGEMLAAEKYCSAIYSAQLRGIMVRNGSIRTVTYVHSGNTETIAPGMVIDCSGDAIVSTYAHCGIIEPDTAKQVPAAVVPVYRAEGRPITTADMTRVRLMLHRGIQAGHLPPALQDMAVISTGDSSIFTIKLNIGKAIKHYCHSENMSLPQAVEKMMALFLMYLQKNMKECGGCMARFDQLAIAHRTGKRVMGKYMLTREDVLSGKKFAQAAAKGCWPIERWGDNGIGTLEYLPDGEYYEIPYDALQSAEIDNLLSGGKCISADEDALASVRVIGTCLATGAAAGKYAAERI